jgi:acetylornithine deacetylase/succinyl-diaminopimelate desuccinylase-like protein
MSLSLAQRWHLVEHRARFLTQLKAFLRFPSISPQPAHKRDINACAAWLAHHLRQIGLSAELLARLGPIRS